MGREGDRDGAMKLSNMFDYWEIQYHNKKSIDRIKLHGIIQIMMTKYIRHT